MIGIPWYKKLRRLVGIFLTLLIFSGCVLPQSVYTIKPGSVVPAVVKCVSSCRLDGDTIRVILPDGSTHKVRLIGVDTPEIKHGSRPAECYGYKAREYTDSHLVGRRVYLEFDVGIKDKYGRLLTYVWLKKPSDVGYNVNYMWNYILVKNGYATVMTVPPNVKYAEKFVEAQKYARSHHKGLWKGCR